MTQEQIKQKAKDVYIRCFDDDFEYSGVLHALEICAEEIANEATKELKEQIEKMKSDVKQEQSYWNSGEMQFCILQDLLEKWKKELEQL